MQLEELTNSTKNIALKNSLMMRRVGFNILLFCFKKLLKYLYSTEFKYSHRDEYLMAIHCGLRIGEVLGLKKQDVDFEKG